MATNIILNDHAGILAVVRSAGILLTIFVITAFMPFCIHLFEGGRGGGAVIDSDTRNSWGINLKLCEVDIEKISCPGKKAYKESISSLETIIYFYFNRIPI